LSKKHISFLDPLRGLAIGMVFLYHCVDAYSPVSDVRWDGLWRMWPDAPDWLLPLYGGWIGVPLFFVISGFCIQLSRQSAVKRGQTAWLPFYLKRFFRVYPPYLVMFLGLWAMSAAGHHPVNPQSVVTHLGLVQNLWPHWMYDLNASLWSVAVEWQLYLIYPMLWVATRAWGWRTCLTLAACLEMALNYWPAFNQLGLGQPLPLFFNHSPFAYWFSWSLGAALADYYLSDRPLLTQWWHRPFWLGALVLSQCFKPLYPLAFLYAALFFASLIARRLFAPAITAFALAAQTQARQGLRNHLAWIGEISYSVYLLHVPVMSLYPWLTRHVQGLQFFDPFSQFVISVLLWPLILLLSWGAYHGVEKPSIRLGQWVLAR
jgi:peptidoglycan/LPS O-acetylase OafA/YrhL